MHKNSSMFPVTAHRSIMVYWCTVSVIQRAEWVFNKLHLPLMLAFCCHLLVTSLSYLNHKKYVFIIFLMAPGAFVTVYPLIFNVLKKVVIISYYY